MKISTFLRVLLVSSALAVLSVWSLPDPGGLMTFFVFLNAFLLTIALGLVMVCSYSSIPTTRHGCRAELWWSVWLAAVSQPGSLGSSDSPPDFWVHPRDTGGRR